MNLLKQKDEVNNVTLALLHEYMDNYLEALKIWQQLKTEEGCDRTISILKRLGKKDIIIKFSKWVLESNPIMGLELFAETVKIGGNSKIDMSADEVIDFLKDLEKGLG